METNNKFKEEIHQILGQCYRDEDYSNHQCFDDIMKTIEKFYTLVPKTTRHEQACNFGAHIFHTTQAALIECINCHIGLDEFQKQQRDKILLEDTSKMNEKK